jgi:LPXTG-motif cell wall-anchored protein
MENSSFDFSSFSENPIQYMTGGDEKTPDLMIVGFVLLFFAGLFFFFSTQIQNSVNTAKASIHQLLQSKINETPENASPSYLVRFLQYLDTLFSDSEEEEEDV